MRVFVPDDRGAPFLFRLASQQQMQVRHLRASVPTLEDVFARRGVGASLGAGMPIHDQGYRHYLGQRMPHGGAWWVIARSHILTAIREPGVPCVVDVAWAPFVVRAVQIYVGHQPPGGRVNRADAGDVSRVPGPAAPVRLSRHDLGGPV